MSRCSTSNKANMTADILKIEPECADVRRKRTHFISALSLFTGSVCLHSWIAPIPGSSSSSILSSSPGAHHSPYEGRPARHETRHSSLPLKRNPVQQVPFPRSFTVKPRPPISSTATTTTMSARAAITRVHLPLNRFLLRISPRASRTRRPSTILGPSSLPLPFSLTLTPTLPLPFPLLSSPSSLCLSFPPIPFSLSFTLLTFPLALPSTAVISARVGFIAWHGSVVPRSAT